MLELRRSQRSPTASLLSSKRCPKGPLASSLPPAKRPQSKSDMFRLFPYNQKDYLFSSSLNVWYGIRISRVVASVWPLQGHSNQRLRAHTLTSRDAGDRVGSDATYWASIHLRRLKWNLWFLRCYCRWVFKHSYLSILVSTIIFKLSHSPAGLLKSFYPLRICPKRI